MRLKKKQATQLPSKPTEYPPGLFIETEKGYFYIFSPDKRYRIITKRVLDSWNPQRVIRTTEAAVKHYRIAAKLKFRNGSLIYNYADAKLYLISQGLRRHITSPDVLDRLFLDKKSAIRVSQDEVNLHEEGLPLK
jgi:hypothetical protein